MVGFAIFHVLDLSVLKLFGQVFPFCRIILDPLNALTLKGLERKRVGLALATFIKLRHEFLLRITIHDSSCEIGLILLES